jgi:hypothetical protein
MGSWGHGLKDLLLSPPQIGGPNDKSIKPWNIIHNAFNVVFSCIYISFIPWFFNLG